MDKKIYQYTYDSIVDKNLKINYGPFRVKHQKMLIELSENINSNEAEDIEFVDLLKRLCLNIIDKEENEIFYNDFEYLFFLIRARSYGENINYSVTNTKKETKEFSFNIFKDIKISGKKYLNEHKVPMENGDIVKITPLTLSEYSSISSNLITEKENYDILTTSIRAILKDEKVTTFNVTEEKLAYFDELTIKDLKKLKIAYNEFPKIETIKKVKVGDEEIITDFGDLKSNFFVIL